MLCQYITERIKKKCNKKATIDDKWCACHYKFIVKQSKTKVEDKKVEEVKSVQEVMSNDIPKIYLYGDKEVYLSNELRDYDPMFFQGCVKNIKNIINKKDIPEEDYLYAQISDDVLKECKESNKKCAKLFITKKWIENNYPKLSISKEVKYDIPLVPERIYLDDNDKFKKPDGSLMDIMIVGERSYDKIYFLVKDIEREFKFEYLRDVVINNDKKYEEEKDYKFFNIPETTNGRQKQNKIYKKELFLTYNGLIRMLFVSRIKNEIINLYNRWIIETLFTHQLGTNEQKEKLASNLIGIPIKTMRDALNRSGSIISCVYLLRLGTVKDLRNIFKISDKIPDNDIVFKYGKTDNLERRLSEHTLMFKKLNIVPTVERYAMIDAANITDAENDIKEFFTLIDAFLNYDNSKCKNNDSKDLVEIIHIENKKLSDIEKLYKSIALRHVGSIKELIEKINNYKEQIENMKIICEQKVMLAEQQIVLIQTQKDLEIMKLKYEIATKK